MARAVFFLAEDDPYKGEEPCFYDNSKFDWVKTLENNWEVVKNEMQEIINGKKEITLSSINPPYLSRKDAWKNIYFYNFLWKHHKNCRKFPKTYALLKSLPNMTFAEFTVLEPHSRVLPHIGETNANIRGHLGIVIPEKHPLMGIRVGNEERGWEEGKVVLFSDAQRHTVWNDSDQRRFVLVFDVMRDEFANRKYWMCAQALSSLMIKAFDERFKFFCRLPRPLVYPFHWLFSAAWYVYLPLQRAFYLP